MSFYSLLDMSSLSTGEKLLKILLSYGLTIEKADNQEPIKKDYANNIFPELWRGRGIEGKSSSCSFLFKGSNEIKFKGMITWNLNVHPNSRILNGIHLWLTIPKNYNISNIIQLGDDIFMWSEAVYGYITKESLDPSNDLKGNAYEGIPELLWVNYFGAPYTNNHDFHIPKDSKSIGHGIRFILTEKPTDERLSDLNFLTSQKEIIGRDWFWSRPRNFNLKVPFFDRSAITNPNLIDTTS